MFSSIFFFIPYLLWGVVLALLSPIFGISA